MPSTLWAMREHPLIARGPTKPSNGASRHATCEAHWWALNPLCTQFSAILAPSPRSSADRAEDFPTTYPAPTSHYLQGSGGEVVGRAFGVR